MLLETDSAPMTLRPYTAEQVRTVCSLRRMRRILGRAWILLRMQCAKDLVACVLLEGAVRERLRVEDEKRLRDPDVRYRMTALAAARLVVMQRVASPLPSGTVTWIDAAQRGYDVVMAYGLAERLQQQHLAGPEYPVDELLSIEYPRDTLAWGAR